MDQDFVKFALYSEQSDSYSLVMHCSKCLHVSQIPFSSGCCWYMKFIMRWTVSLSSVISIFWSF